MTAIPFQGIYLKKKIVNTLLVSWGYHNKLLQIWWLKTAETYSPVPEANRALLPPEILGKYPLHATWSF